MYQQFISFLHNDMTEAVEILPQVSREFTYSTNKYHGCWDFSSDARSHGIIIRDTYYVEPK